jgi:hypothetical protein
MDESTKREIDRVTWRTLRDAGLTEPPVRIESLLAHLDLYRSYYDLQDPGFLDRAKQRIKIGRRKLIDVVKKISLQAVLFFDENRMVIDDSLPLIKREWPSFHEVSHKIIPWHRAAFYGDTAQTLDPDWHERLEAEANYGASTLMFCGRRFTEDAKDTRPEWASVQDLVRRYGKSISTTLRRYVGFGPDFAMAMLVSTPKWMAKPDDQVTRCRHFVVSPSFASRYACVTGGLLLAEIDRHARRRFGGPVADFTCAVHDDRGQRSEFRGESFFNGYYLQTLFVERAALGATVPVSPRSPF